MYGPMNGAYGGAAAIGPPTAQVELYLSAKNLKDRDLISKSDPFAVLYLKQGGSWVKLGETESIKDQLNPTWAKQFLLDYYFSVVQELKVEIYDRDNDSSKLSKQDIIGKADFTLGQVMGGPGRSCTVILRRHGSTGSHQGSLLVRAEQTKSSNEAARLRFSASGLPNMDGFFSKSDPFLVINRAREDGTWMTVWKSEVIKNNLNPSWKVAEIPVQKLCNGDHTRPLQLQVFDEDSGGKYQLIGQVNSSLAELLSKKGENFVLHNEELQRKKGKKYTNAGLLTPADVALIKVHSFVDYLAGGCEINLIVGIDYTASNGTPNDPRSLHFLNPHAPNQYQCAISATGAILQEYDADKKFPVYGFGGIPPGALGVNHCFALNLNPTNPEVNTVQGILQLYAQSLPHVQLNGPTYFAPLIRQASQIAASFTNPQQQKFFVLLILTDGAIMDMQHTIDAIVDASYYHPLSIVIIGVGNADFSSMSALDGDGNILRASNGRAAARDIVQFVPYNKYAASTPMLAKETLAEIPNQLCQYFKVRGIGPNPVIAPVYTSVQQAPIAEPAPGQPPVGQSPVPQAAPGQPPMAQPVPGQAPMAQLVPDQVPMAQLVPGYPNPHGYPGYPPHVAPQGYPPQGAYPPHGYPPQAGYPGYPPQGAYPPHGYPPQAGYPPQGAGYPSQGYAPQGMAVSQMQYPAGFGGNTAQNHGGSTGRQAAPGYPGYRGP